MSMKLEINEEPLITSYAHHAYANAIISGRCELYDNKNEKKEVMNICVNNCSIKEWKIKGNEKLVKINNNNLVIIDDDKDDCHGEFFIYYSESKKSELCVTISHIQIDSQEAIFNMFVTAGDVNQCIENNKSIYRFGFTQKNLLSRYDNDFRRTKNCGQMNSVSLKIAVEDDRICSYIFEDEQFVLFDSVNVDLLNRQISIGVNVNNLGNEIKKQYETWLAMNYVQLYYDKNDIVGKVWLDYKMFPRKNYRYDYAIFSQFLDIDYQDLFEIKEMFGDILSFVKWSLQHDYYVAIPLNEFYIPNRDAYQDEKYVHHNLIYGFDEDKGLINILGYNKKLVCSEVPVSQFVASCRETDGEVIRYRFFPNCKLIKFDLQFLCNELSDFLNGNHTHCANVLSDAEGFYGIKALKALKSDERGIYLLCHDFRVSYVIYEHSMLMRKRIMFLHNKYAEYIEFAEMSSKSEELVNITCKLKNMVIKNMFRKNLNERIIDLLETVIDKEERLFSNTLELLTKVKELEIGKG